MLQIKCEKMTLSLKKHFICLVLFISTSNFVQHAEASLQGEEVSIWANTIGKELWTLGNLITKFSELKQKYTFHNAKVGKKNPRELLAEIKEKMSVMVNRKVNAIKAIQEHAEENAEKFVFQKESVDNYTYYSSKYSNMSNSAINLQISNLIRKFPSLKGNKPMYRRMMLDNDTHFYNLMVNTTHSAVHVPVNIYDKEDTAAAAIQWSESLDEVFVRNYNGDPALSWQYFGSTTGIMRHYPAQHWDDSKKDLFLFDCRIRTWFIEASTCTKDVIILFDNSGSMEGLGHHIGALTVKSILDTLSNNDYVNIMNYTDRTNYLVPCFEDMLVQATKENIGLFTEAIDSLDPEGKTQLGQALEVAFNLLAKNRIKKGCDDEDSSCNQAIMIITDGVQTNMSDVILKYNYLNNGSNIPVRLFTYLIGKEVTNLPEIQWISCANRGYYSHVQSLEQVTASVFQYISVIARPLVLQGADHPVSWTHAYADLTYDDKNDMTINEPYRLLTSVAIPCYDTKINKKNDSTTAYLLGVAGTDVPLDEFEKLMFPYKVGVNGYAFIVSNNGYILMHPDLRPVFQGVLKHNYNSIDITQVEQHFPQPGDETGYRAIVKSLMNLREALVNEVDGSLHNIKLKYHYDQMTRVVEASYDYYYTRLENTPFTIGIAIPHEYGNYTLEVGDEIFKNKHTGLNLTSFFNGKWKIHPKWVYCKYHYLEGHEYPSPEKELLHFLEQMYNRDFKWDSQYEAQTKKLEIHDYYCDRNLVERLIFDAKNTNESFGEEWSFKKREEPLFKRYYAFLRFVATMSGLTRWHYIFEETRNNVTKGFQKEFGDLHPRAINEQWYKSAVIQHQYDESFVYSVPAYGTYNTSKDNDLIVTASFAIFPSDGGKEAPGSVVGYQFSQTKLQMRVKEISNKSSNQCSHCGTCSTTLDCYVVDSAGYIIVSDNQEDTSKFFGEVEGDIMKSLLEENIFKMITLYDYQALCLRGDGNGNSTSSSNLLLTPLRYVEMALYWFFMKVLHLLVEINIQTFNQVIISAQDIVADVGLYSNDSSGTVSPESTDDDDDEGGEEEIAFDDKSDDYFACEKELKLFVLQQDLFITGNFPGEVNRPNQRNYYVKRIPNSNLIFLAINNTIPKNMKHTFTTTPQAYTSEAKFKTGEPINSSLLLPCQKLKLNNLSRRILTGCYNEHPLEHEIMDCSDRATDLKVSMVIICFPFLLFTFG